jgi:glycogen debranching enzyme
MAKTAIQQSYPQGRDRLKINLAARCVPIAADGHFLLMSNDGTIDGSSFFGYYYSDNRMLDKLIFTVDGVALKLRNFTSSVFEAHYVYTNEDQTLLVDRRVTICKGVVERIKLTSFTEVASKWQLEISYGADFRAMGEVRDMGPTGKGDMLKPVIGDRSVRFGWNGEDAQRRTTLHFRETPTSIDHEQAVFTVSLAPGASTTLEYAIKSSIGDQHFRTPLFYDKATRSAKRHYDKFRRSIPAVTTGSPEFNALLEESLRGIYMLRYYARKGECMAAGLPWYFCLFARDICIWILQAGWLFPELSMNVLLTLEQYQAHDYDLIDPTEARPGKIPHEVREDQLGMMKQIIYHNCCWAVDTAPLYVVAACEMAKWTGNMNFARQIYQSLKDADACITAETVEGLVVYHSVNRTNKFFMEEPQSVTDEFGVVPESPKAVCDVQGFAWQARVLLGQLADRLGDHEFAAEKRVQADFQRDVFQKRFWDEEMQYPLFAIGGVGVDPHPCRVFQTDALLLPPGLLTAEQEQAVARRAQEPDLYTPWGILPVSSKGRVFKPFFIQSQCVCPFHTVMGGVQWFLRTGHDEAGHQLVKGLMEARNKLGHLPELYIVPNNDVGPLLYAADQMACFPQLWTAGAPVHAVALCMNVMPADDGSVIIDHASIPEWMGFIEVRDLRVAGQVLDLSYRYEADGSTSVKRLRTKPNRRAA